MAGKPAVPGLVALSASLGLLALALAVALASPALEQVSQRSIEWTQLATIRGNFELLLLAAVLAGARAVATELVRRWILDAAVARGVRVALALGLVAALELAITWSHPAARVGAAIAGLGYGLLYLGAGRRVEASIAARLVFEIGALVLVWARLV